MCGLRSEPATLRIGLIADLMQLLESPRRRRDQAERAPPPDDRRRHIAHGSRLAYGRDLFLSTHHTNVIGASAVRAPQFTTSKQDLIDKRRALLPPC
jgi:hypothetical protein